VGTKHPDEAWDFLSWLTAPEQSARFCAKLNNIPPKKAALEHPDFVKVRRNARFEFFVQLIAEGKALPAIASPMSQQLQAKLQRGTESFLGGRLPAERLLKTLDDELNDELQQTEKLMGTKAK